MFANETLNHIIETESMVKYDHEVKMFIPNEDSMSKLPKGELFLLVNGKMVKMEDIK